MNNDNKDKDKKKSKYNLTRKKTKIKNQSKTDTLDRSKLHNRIAYYRLLQNISQKDMSDVLEMSGGNYGKIERGEIDVSFTNLEKIAKRLEISICDLVSDERFNKSLEIPSTDKDTLIIKLQQQVIELQKQVIDLQKKKK